MVGGFAENDLGICFNYNEDDDKNNQRNRLDGVVVEELRLFLSSVMQPFPGKGGCQLLVGIKK